jgi:thiol-disulfide isomerase/thioredoxin
MKTKNQIDKRNLPQDMPQSSRGLFLILAFILNFFVFSNLANAQKLLPNGFERLEGDHPAPKTQFADQNGRQTSVNDFKGKVVVVNVWATWCAPCVKEMPSLARLASQLPADRFAVIAVSQDKGGLAVAKPFLTRLGIAGLPIFFDPMGRMFRDFGGRGLPTTFIIGQDGLVISRLEGSADWDADNVVSYLRSLPNEISAPVLAK